MTNGTQPAGTQPTSMRQLVIAAIISGTVASSVLGLAFTGYVTRTQEEVKSQRAWKEKSVAELLGPMSMQLDRTRGALERWNKQNLYIEAKIMKVGNETVRDLLLTKGHLIPPDLVVDANKLIEHYDVWLELYEKHRGGKEPDLKAEFVFAAPAGFGFPKEAEAHFKERLRAFMKDLYGI
jgi:hypothetical protein